MKSRYLTIIEEVSSRESKFEQLSYLTSILRSLLQLVAVTGIEVANLKVPSQDLDLSSLVERMCSPSDGLPIEVFEHIIPSVRTYVDVTFCLGWYADSNYLSNPLSKQLIEWVNFRNSRAGHGVIDEPTATEWSEKTRNILTDALRVFDQLIPVISDDGTLVLSPQLDSQKIYSPLHFEGAPIIISKVTCNKGVWRLKGQSLSISNSQEFQKNIIENNIFSLRNQKSNDRYTLSEMTVESHPHSLFQNIPIRQTDIFEGRSAELAKLGSWINDQDSRICLVFGDGGYGKTTLVLEFINRLIEDSIDVQKPAPLIVSFHTAKMTRWSEDGLVHIKGISSVMDECLRELVRLFLPKLTKDWYQVDGKQLIQKTINVLRDEKFSRDDVLLIFDNTETLATTTEEVESLGEFLVEISRKVGRLIITSRRREYVNATPIPVKELAEGECLLLMKKLAKTYGAIPILQAGEPRLKGICKKLTFKPLLITALVRYIGLTKVAIESALESVIGKSNDDLLEFLYEDAWLRMNISQQRVCLILTKISSPLDQRSIGKACQLIEMPLAEFHKALDETYFGSVISYGENFSMEFVDLAVKFFEKKLKEMPAEGRSLIHATAEAVDTEVSLMVDIERSYRTDRVAEAFRSPFAKAAKIAVDKGDNKEAKEMYELAIADEPLNSALHDRFAWFLFHKLRDFGRAEELWVKSVKLNPNNCDAVVNIALSRYRSGNLIEGDQYIDYSRKLGRSFAFCMLNKAKARYYLWKRSGEKGTFLEVLEQASGFIKEGLRKTRNNSDSYDNKVKQELLQLVYEVREAIASERLLLKSNLNL